MTADAAVNLRQALRIYEHRHADLLAQHTRDTLAGIGSQTNP
jgi:hypothetical protein